MSRVSPNNERVKIESLSDTFTGVTLTYGFMETPSVEQGPAAVPQAWSQCRPGVDVILPLATEHCGRPPARRCPFWQEKLFIWLAGSAEDATTYFQIPSDRVVEIGTQIVV